jgi:hypothetical protein
VLRNTISDIMRVRIRHVVVRHSNRDKAAFWIALLGHTG